MTTVHQIGSSGNSRHRPGRPRLRTAAKEREITRQCVKRAIIIGQMPSDADLGQRVGLSERTLRAVRLEVGLDRWDVARWVKEREAIEALSPERAILGGTPFTTTAVKLIVSSSDFYRQDSPPAPVVAAACLLSPGPTPARPGQP